MTDQSDQSDQPKRGDAVPTRTGGWRPTRRPRQPEEHPIDPAPAQPDAAEPAPAEPDAAQPDAAPAEADRGSNAPAPARHRARHRFARRRGGPDSGGDVSEPPTSFDSLAPGWSGLAPEPAAAAHEPRRPPANGRGQPTEPADRPASPRSWLADDDFADLLQPTDSHKPAGQKSPPPANPAEPAARSSEPPVETDATETDATEADEHRLAADELPWGVPARAAAGDGPLPPAEQVQRHRSAGQIVLIVLAACAAFVVLAFVALVVLARLRGTG